MNERFTEMVAAWSALRSDAMAHSFATWHQHISAMKARQAELVARGDWLSGPSDMMRLLKVNDLELKHSQMVAWLLTPTARHRLGDRILSRLLVEGWSDREPMSTSSAIVQLEQTVSATRADIVVYMPEGTLVIENKVWASEDIYQCEALYEEWIRPGADIRFLLLTRDGHTPRSTRSAEASTAWRSISYGSFAALLAAELASTDEDGSSGRDIAKQYLATLRGMSLVGRQLRVTSGGGTING